MQDGDVEIVTIVENSRDVALRFYLEPWGEEYVFPAGANFTIMSIGPPVPTVDIAIESECVTVWAWPDSTVTLFHDSLELGRKRLPMFPRAPTDNAPTDKSTKASDT